jgi:superfamily II DNA/RNA helicase
MADMGFLPAVKRILNYSKKDSQRMLFSATLDRGVDGLVRQYLRDPKEHSIKEVESSKGKMDHYVFVVDQSDKASITNLIASRDGKTIFFVRTQRGADKLTANLAKVGVRADALHGGKSQSVRTKTLARFKEKSSAVLVATDVAARGIHVDGIDLVVHYDVPADHKDYLHRSGRTARAGELGRVVTLVTRSEQRSMNGITLRAGVEAWVMAMTPSHEKLTSITGANEPSGIPLIEGASSTHKKSPNSSNNVKHPRGKKSDISRKRRRRFASAK